MTLTRVIIVKVSRQNHTYPRSNPSTYIFLRVQLEKEIIYRLTQTRV